MTEAGSIIGTAQYLSPEQARGAPVDRRSDIYSVGIVLYEMLTGAVPFTGDTPLEIAMKHLSAIPEPPLEEAPRRAARARLGRPARAREGPRGPLPERRGDGRRPRAHRQRPGGRAETEEAATHVACAAPRSGDRRHRRPHAARSSRPARTARPTGYYEYDEPPRRAGSFWPWLLAMLRARRGRGARRFLVRHRRTSWTATKRSPCPFVEGIVEALAVQKLDDAGLGPQDRATARTTDVAKGTVVRADPRPGRADTDKGNSSRSSSRRASRRSTCPTWSADQASRGALRRVQEPARPTCTHVPNDQAGRAP